MKITDTFFQEETPGEFKKYLKIPENCRIKKATLKVEGLEYKGMIKPDSPGISTIPVGTDPGDQFIIDFHIFRNVYDYSKRIAGQNVKKVQQWGGIKFLDDDITSCTLVKTEKILVTFHGDVSFNAFKQDFNILVMSYPSNLTISLEDESPFWSYPGEFTRSLTIPDFSEKLLNYIDVCKPDTGYCTVPLTFRSDSSGNLKITEKLDYNLLWDKFPEKMITFDGIETKKEILEIKSSKNRIQLCSINLNYKGNLSDEFIDDHWTSLEKKVSVKMSTGKNIGLKIQPSDTLRSTGLDFYLRMKKSKDATLFAEIVEDWNGKPAEEIVLASKNVDLSSQSLELRGWISIGFDENVLLDKEKTYWLVLKAGTGEVEWFCSNSEDPKRPGGFIFRNGSSDLWIPYPVTGYFRLKYLPESEDISPIIITILDRKIYLKPTMESHSIQISFENTEIPVDVDGKAQIYLEITSATSGKLEVSNIVVEGREVA